VLGKICVNIVICIRKKKKNFKGRKAMLPFVFAFGSIILELCAT
jgi:hypothetical protein